MPQAQSDMFQEDLERALYTMLTQSQMFQHVTLRVYDPKDVDYVLRLQPAELRCRRMMDPLFIPLSFITVTLNIWLGLPIGWDTETYRMTVRVEDRDGGELFQADAEGKFTNSFNLYSGRNKPGAGAVCGEGHEQEVLNDLVTKIDHGLKQKVGTAR